MPLAFEPQVPALDLRSIHGAVQVHGSVAIRPGGDAVHSGRHKTCEAASRCLVAKGPEPACAFGLGVGRMCHVNPDANVRPSSRREISTGAPLDFAATAGRRLDQQQSVGILAGAGNLFDKAARAWADGDSERARLLVARCLSLPYDEHERAVPALWTARLRVYTLVANAVEASDEGDQSWLERIGEVLDESDGWQYEILDHAVGEVGYSADFTGASPSTEVRRIADLAPGYDPEHDAADHLPAEQHEDFVVAAAALTARLSTELQF